MKYLMWAAALGVWVYAQVDEIYTTPKERQKYRQEKQALRASTEDPRYDNYEDQYYGGCRSCDDDYIYTRRLRNFYGVGCAPIRDPFLYDPFWGPRWVSPWYSPWGPSWVYTSYRVGWSYVAWPSGYYVWWGDPWGPSWYNPWGPSWYYGTGYGLWGLSSGYNVSGTSRNYAPRTRSTIQFNTRYRPRPNSSSAIQNNPPRRIGAPSPNSVRVTPSLSPRRSGVPVSAPRRP